MKIVEMAGHRDIYAATGWIELGQRGDVLEGAQHLAAPNSASRVWASRRSTVSKPSVNQP
jgi:hypothetical protein